MPIRHHPHQKRNNRHYCMTDGFFRWDIWGRTVYAIYLLRGCESGCWYRWFHHCVGYCVTLSRDAGYGLRCLILILYIVLFHNLKGIFPKLLSILDKQWRGLQPPGLGRFPRLSHSVVSRHCFVFCDNIRNCQRRTKCKNGIELTSPVRWKIE